MVVIVVVVIVVAVVVIVVIVVILIKTSLNQRVSEWQGLLMSCLGQLKSCCCFSFRTWITVNLRFLDQLVDPHVTPKIWFYQNFLSSFPSRILKINFGAAMYWSLASIYWSPAPIYCLKLNQHWVPGPESMLIQSHFKVFFWTPQLRNLSKWGSTSDACNSAWKTPFPPGPLPYILWTLWTWGFTRYH